MRARGLSPSASALARDISSTAAAPSEICDDVPAVCRPPSSTGLRAASFSSEVSRRPPSRSTRVVSPVGWPSSPSRGASIGAICEVNRPSDQARAAFCWEASPNSSRSSRLMSKSLAIRSAPVNWSGRSRSQPSGRGTPGPPKTAAPRPTRDIISTPHAMPTSIASAAIRPAMKWLACWAEPHWQSMVVTPAPAGSPADSQA